MVRGYQPHPSTLPYKMIQHLRSLPPGTFLPTAPLAQAVGTETSTVYVSLEAAVKHGVVRKEKRDGFVCWGIGDGVPPVAEALQSDARQVWTSANGTPLDPTVPYKTKDERGAEIDAIAKEIQPKPPKAYKAKPAKPAKATEPVALPVSEPFTYSWRSDGVVGISHSGIKIVLSPAEAAELRRFLNHAVEFNPALD